jgi:hypothetical protein
MDRDLAKVKANAAEIEGQAVLGFPAVHNFVERPASKSKKDQANLTSPG